MSLIALHVSLVFGLLLLAAAIGALGFRRRWTSDAVYALSALTAAGATALAVAHAVTGGLPAELALPGGLPGVGIRLRINSLSLVFLAVVNGTAALVSLYAIGYGRHEHPGRVLALYPLFLVGMNVVLVADDAFTFLIGWEFMSLASWGMVAARHEDPDACRAAHLYLVMACGGAFALLFAFGVLAGHAGDYSFAAIRARSLTGWMPELALMLIVIGTGSKAGLVPLHVWLPLAHPAAPSHVSALMSGAMTKVAIYGTIRLVFDLMPAPQWYWALPFLFAGISTAVIGLLQALVERDLKRLLAFSTIENIGIIYVALGLTVAFTAARLAAPAAVALAAALFHVANHAVMKSLVFCGAGAVLHAVGSKDLEKLGGLLNRMPMTGALMLVGRRRARGAAAAQRLCLRMAGVPGHPGQPAIAGGGAALPGAGGRRAAGAGGGAGGGLLRARLWHRLPRPAALAGGGERPRGRPHLARRHGFDGGPVHRRRRAVAAGGGGAAAGDGGAGAWRAAGAGGGGHAPLSLTPFEGGRSTYNGFMIGAFLVVSSFLASFGIHRIATRATRRASAWDCGFPDASPATQYTASSFGQPIRRVFVPIALWVRRRW